MSQFNVNANKTQINKVNSIVELLEDHFDTSFGNIESMTEIKKDNILGYHVDGFIPFQMGGYDLSMFISNYLTYSSYHVTKNQTEFNNGQYDNLIEDFTRSKSIINFSYDDLTEDEKEELLELEYQYEELALIGYYVYINNDQSITVTQYINYKDMPYYREKYNEVIKSVTFEENEEITLDVLVEIKLIVVR